MSIVCTICQDLITEIPQRLPAGEDFSILALQCGHLFHRSCIMEWFQKTGNQTENGQCPCCKVGASIQQGLRIFPSGDEESSAIADKLGLAKAHCEQNAQLKEELSQINMLLEEVGCQLENERVEHEILKYEYTQKDSEVDELRRQTEVNDRRSEEIENIWKETVEKITFEKQDALEKLKIAESRLVDEKLELENRFINKIKELEEKGIQAVEKQLFNKVQEYENKLRIAPIPKAEKACQTDGRDASLLQARLVSYKSCMLHMQSEIRLLEDEYAKLQIQQTPSKEFVYFIDSDDELDKQFDQLRDVKDTKPESLDYTSIDCVEMGDANNVDDVNKGNKDMHSEEDGSSSTGAEDFSDAPLFWLGDE